MSSESTARRRKSEKAADPERRAPMFEVRHEPLPERPAPLQATRDPFDLPEARPRAARSAATIARVAAPASRPPAPLDRATAALPLGGMAEPERRALPKQAAQYYAAEAWADRTIAPAPRHHRPMPQEAPLEYVRGRPWLLILVAAASLVIFWFASAKPQTIISGFSGNGPFAAAVSNTISNAIQPQDVPAGEHAVVGEPTVSAQFIDSVLAHYGSPAQGTGKVWVEMGRRYRIDPAYALAFFIHESSAGTNPGWAGIKPGGSTTHNVGNIICAGYATCFGRFRDYESWDVGIEDWYKLIANEYIVDRGAVTVEQIIPVYAPSFENDVNNYVRTVIDLADTWRQGVVR